MFTWLLQRARLDTEPLLDNDDDAGVNVELINQCIRDGIKFPSQNNPIRDYWRSLGLAEFPYARHPPPDIALDENAVQNAYDYVKLCNTQFFERIADPVTCATWDIDGLCATGKSSVDPRIKKSNHHLHMIGQNLHLSSALGYVFSSVKMMRSQPHTVWDRTAFNNVYPWFYNWLLIAHVHLNYNSLYRGVYRNSYFRRTWPIGYKTQDESTPLLETDDDDDDDTCFDQVLSDTVLDVWRRHATAIHPHTRQVLGKLAKHIIVVDSDEREATRRLRDRATGSDVERSFWPHYVRIQNYMYAQMALLDPAHYCVLDLRAFNGNQTLMQSVIRKIIGEHPAVGDQDAAAFEPFMPVKAKAYLTPDAESSERTRPVQSWRFTNDTKLFIDEYTKQDAVLSSSDEE